MIDCLVIGGGPAGLTAATYLARYRRNVALIDEGRSRARLIPESHNVPGFTGIAGPKLLRRLEEQARQYDVTFSKGEVTALRREADGSFRARFEQTDLAARFAILATGLVDRQPKITGAAAQSDAIRFCPICDGFEAMDRRIAVLGDGAAGRKAAFLRTYSNDVRWFTVDSTPKEQATGVTFCGPAAHIEIVGSSVVITSADGARHEVDLIYPALGCEVRSGLATALGARCTEVGTLVVDDHQRTSVPGLYAIGDVVTDLHQISVATGHAALAATDVHNRLPSNPR